MGKPSAPEPPDYSGVAAASERSAKLSFRLGRQQLRWGKKVYRDQKHTYNQIVKSFMADQREASQNAAEDRQFYEDNFRPLEKQLAEDAATYDTPERRTKEMGAASSMVAEQFDSQRQNAARDLEAYGIDPSSTRSAALDIGVRAAQAAAQAAASTSASNRVEDTARALRSEAINVGRGYPGQIAQSYQTASQMGQGAGQQMAQSTQNGAMLRGSPTAYMGQGQNALDMWRNTLNTSYQNQLGQFQANQQASSGWGSLLGLAGGLATKAFGFADGGAVPDGEVIPSEPQRHVTPDMSPSAGEETDDVPARLNVGEFVIPEDAVSWYGEKHMYGLIDKAKKERAEMQQQTGAIPELHPPLEQAPVFQS